MLGSLSILSTFESFVSSLDTLGFVVTILVGVLRGYLSASFSIPQFSIVECSYDTCPGSSYNLITAAWANIGYMTHSDFLALLTDTKFGWWAPLLYVVGAIGALIGVAINTPPKQYIWFLMGPGIYWFLVDTKENVSGVSWMVAGQMQPMKEVWKDAETGLANTQLIKRLGISVNRDNGPSGQYPVAWMLVFLDKLFSASTNQMVSWVGIGRQMGTGAADSNLAAAEGNGEGPWYILANLKWGMLENIVGVQARDPDVRDALVTFLASECGDQFKKGVHSANYIAASTARGGCLPGSVFKTDGVGDASFCGDQALPWPGYKKFVHGMDTEAIPTPRSLIRLFSQDPQTQGSFRSFAQKFKGSTNDSPADRTGRTVEIVCSEYLYTIVEALRWESGHAFWQLIRASPQGFTRNGILKSIFYGWDIRKQTGARVSDGAELEDFVKHLIFVYMLKNELLYAPQITEAGQRFAPSDQTRNFSESYVRSQGSRSKASELYNWAVMMPHVQGILTYLVLIFYPFAAMLMVIPGYWKAFFTWISFFAWVKLWDVGFAICHTLERSVWAMIGNHSAMARVANMLVQSAGHAGSIQVGLQGNCAGDPRPNLCAVPDVTEAKALSQDDAWGLLDKTLLLTGSADLDLSNGYYVYIMSALYFAVPAVTGQLVLGAKAGMSSLATQAIGQSASEAGGAAKSATVGESVNKLQTNQGSLVGATTSKAHRSSGLVLQQLDNANAAAEMEMGIGRTDGIAKGLGNASDATSKRKESFGAAAGFVGQAFGVAGSISGGGPGRAGTGADATGANVKSYLAGNAGKLFDLGTSAVNQGLTQQQLRQGANAGAFGAQASWNTGFMKTAGSAFGNYSQALGAEAEYNAAQSAWEAKNDFATHLAGLGGVSGLNPGNLNPGVRPTDRTGLALSGQLGARAEGAARFSGFDFWNDGSGQIARARRIQGLQSQYGGSWYNSHWGGGYTPSSSIGQSLRGGVSNAQSASDYAGRLKDAGQEMIQEAGNNPNRVKDAAKQATTQVLENEDMGNTFGKE